MKKGFTLIELLVSVAIFSIVMVISLGALLAISASDRKAETLKAVMTNLNFALDSMSRSIRTGVNYHCGSGGTLSVPTDCPSNPSNAFTFLANDGSQVTYWLDTVDTDCGQTGSTIGCIMRRTITQGGLGVDSGALQITAPEILISNFAFYVTGSCSASGSNGTCTPDALQPKVTISISGFVQVNGTATTQSTCIGQSSSGTSQCSAFNLETSITQRIYDQ